MHQNTNKELEKAVAGATSIHYYNDPLHLAIPYVFFLEMLPEPPDGLTKSTLSLALIIFVYVYPVLTALIKSHMKIAGSYVLLSGDKNVFIKHGQPHSKKLKPLLQMHIKVHTTNAEPPNEPFF